MTPSCRVIVLGLLILFVCTSGVAADPAQELRACWLTHYAWMYKTESQLRSIAQTMKAGNINTVYLCVYGGQQALWPSKAYQAAGGTVPSSTLDRVDFALDIFHDEGLKVGAFFEYGLAVGYSSHPIAVANPDWLARDSSGGAVTGENGGFVFLSPGSEGAMSMIEAMIRELAENYSFDDIQLDRFRWARKTSGREYGYESATSSLYEALYGSAPPSNVNNSQWVSFREGLVNAVVQRCYNVVKEANPKIAVSCAPVGSYGITQHMQRWAFWVEGGYMDLVIPQMYKTSLGSFENELDTQMAQAPDHLEKLAVGYRASESSDATLVAQQMEYARSQGIDQSTLWVFHYYSSVPAIQDELDLLPQAGQPWNVPAENPFVSEHNVQIIIDNRDTLDGYTENGTWSYSSQPDYFRFDSKIANGPGHEAFYSSSIPQAGRYAVYVWYTASSNRNDQAIYRVHHVDGISETAVNQRSNGGQWVRIGSWFFEPAGQAVRISLSSEAATSGEYTSSDAVKLVLCGTRFGDADWDLDVDLDDLAVFASCLSGPAEDIAEICCEAFDWDGDDDVDLEDFLQFQQVFDND